MAASSAHAADEFLPPEVAFRPDVRDLDDHTVDVSYAIAPGYYLYRDRLQFDVGDGATIDLPVTPPGHIKFDETLQKNVETYRDGLHVKVTVRQAPAHFHLTLTSQGCADKGLCYPPQTATADVSLRGFGGDGSARMVTVPSVRPNTLLGGLSTLNGNGNGNGAGNGDRTGDVGPAGSNAYSAPTPPPADTANTPRPSAADDAGHLGRLLQSGNLWAVVAAFFVAGVLLSLTPCVLPMLPILSSIIVGQSGGASRRKGVLLASAYSLGMALVYTLFGVAAGLAGEGLAAWLQNPWVLGLFAAGLAALGVSMLNDGVELRLPASLTVRLSAASNRLPAGRLAGVFAMGGVSAVIVSPCVAAPLAGALIYLSQTRDVLLGGTALFALAAGMSVPLLLLGASAGALLPRAGAWMDDVKRLFGLLLLAVAVWTLQPVLPGALCLAAWGALLLAAAVVAVVPGGAPGGSSTGAASMTAPRLRRTVAAVCATFGLLQLLGAASGGTDPLQPLSHLARAPQDAPTMAAAAFITIHSPAELDAHLRAGRPVLLDFYADWCKSCKEMEATTYADPSVRRRMSQAVLLKADVTANSADERDLLRRYGLFGPPGTIFFDADGRERSGTRVIGYQDVAGFSRSLTAAGL